MGQFDGVGGEGSENIGGGVGRDIFVETCGERFVDNRERVVREVPVNGKRPLRMRREAEVRRSRRCRPRPVGRWDGWNDGW